MTIFVSAGLALEDDVKFINDFKIIGVLNLGKILANMLSSDEKIQDERK